MTEKTPKDDPSRGVDPLSGSRAKEVSDLRVADLLTFLAVVRSSSLTAAAREREVTPSQVSKAITRVETHFAKKLVDRGSRGVVLSEAGRILAPTLESIVTQLESARAPTQDGTELTLGAPSYLQLALLPVLGAAAPNVRIRAFELPPSLLRATAQDDQFDVLLLPGGAEHLPPSWEATIVGEIRRGLFASPTLRTRLGKGPVPMDRLVDIPFVCPVYRQQGRVVPVEDDFPLPRTQRRVGHQVNTFLVGLEVAARTEQLVFGPAVAAQRYLDTGALVEISVQSAPSATSPLTFACNVDRVSARVRGAFSRAIKETMDSGAARLTE